MDYYYCIICDRSINDKPRNKHKKTKSHYFMKNYVTNIYNYNNIVWGDVENILHENIISHNNKFNEFKTYVSCKLNDDLEINIYKNESDMLAVLPYFLYPKYDIGTTYVDIAGKMIFNNIRENLNSKYGINCTPDMKIKNLAIKFVSRYSNMTFRYQLQQPRRIPESKIVKHIKYKPYEEQINNYNFLTCKHKLCLL